MSSKFATCSKGKSQSPIDIVKDGAVFGKHLQKLVRRYNTANATLVNNGFNIGVDFGEKTGGVAVIDDKNYSLRQMHWHSPSEHLLNGERYVHCRLSLSKSLSRLAHYGPSPSNYQAA
ncbi:alpha carbonic anhydrase 1, chloroplastic-like [Cucurbita pepo subsp. pepo]|uniref:alpha carbonic anhydrase 1, chloroplastic-like n=1 Tax=Cucurbita pepo subsp. pepo TaxID=3664 RepID=UPI000C9D27E2|nr:alpha carbonic anhydrase 1, chloroplastic-like [Cucurbita pepo subsp. pepo]